MSQTRRRYGTRLASVVRDFQLPLSRSIGPLNIPPTYYPYHTMASRPGPLRDLPLERFIDPQSTPVPTTPRRAHKRRLSPGTPNLFSPTKRRILAQEGVFSPEKTIKSFIVPSDRALVIHNVLKRSPARKLDFGQLPRPDGKVPLTSPLLEDCFMEPAPEPSRSAGQHDRDHSSIPMFSAFPSQPLPIPSSSSNSRTSFHHPGFDICMDHEPAPSLLPSSFPMDSSNPSDEDKENLQDDKENLYPKTKRQTGLSNRMQKVSFTSPKQPRRSNTLKIPFTPLNARGPLKARLQRATTPGKALNLDKDEMQRRKAFLAMEVDGDESSDGDL